MSLFGKPSKAGKGCGAPSNKVVMLETWLRGTLAPALGCDGWKVVRAGLQRCWQTCQALGYWSSRGASIGPGIMFTMAGEPCSKGRAAVQSRGV